VTASHSALTYRRNFGGLDPAIRDLFGDPAFAYRSNGRTFNRRIGLQPLSGSSRAELNQAVGELTETLRDRLPKEGPWAAQISSQVRFDRPEKQNIPGFTQCTARFICRHPITDPLPGRTARRYNCFAGPGPPRAALSLPGIRSFPTFVVVT
jgi:hypothetical protein